MQCSFNYHWSNRKITNKSRGNPAKEIMELTIFTGLNSGARFYDCFTDGDGFSPDEYADCTRHDFSISENEIDERGAEKILDLGSFTSCLKGVDSGSLKKFIHGLYINPLERELTTELIAPKIRDLVIDDWKQDCLSSVVNIYRGKNEQCY